MNQASAIFAIIVVMTTSLQSQVPSRSADGKKTIVSPSLTARRISIDPPCFDFGEVPVDSEHSKLFKINITGGKPDALPGIIFPDSCVLKPCMRDSQEYEVARLDTTGFVLIPGDTAFTIRVKFTPTDTVHYCSSILFSVKASGGDSAVNYIGKGIAAVPKFCPSAHDFGDVLTGDTARWNFTIKNTGRYFLKIDTMEFRQKHAYRVQPDTARIEPGESMIFQISFFPQYVDDYLDTLVISKNSRFGDSMLVLRGRGIQQPVIVLSDTAHDFGEVAIGDSVRWCFKVKNKGNQPLAISDISVNQDTIFRVAPRSCRIAPRESLNVCVVFAPKDTADYLDTLVVHSNADTADSVITLRGKGCAPIVGVSADTIFFPAICINETASRNFVIQNLGCDTLKIRGIEAEKYPGVFKSSFTDDELAANETTTATVTFTPDTAQNYEDLLVISTNTRFGNSTIALTGQGLLPPIISVHPNRIEFGNQCLNQQSWGLVTVGNAGDKTLYVKANWTRRDVFAVSPDSFSIAPGNTQEVKIEFSSSMIGEYSDSVVFCSNADSAATDTSVSLHAKTIDAYFTVNPDSLKFGEIGVTEAAVDSFWIINHCERNVYIDSVRIQPSRHFSSGVDTLTVPAFGRVAVPIIFRPEGIGDLRSTLIIYHHEQCAEDTVYLFGTGCAPQLTATEPETLDFGDVGVGNARVLAFRRQNHGCDTLKVDPVWVEPGPVYTILSYTDIVPSGESLKVNIKFAPDSLKAYPGVLKVTSNDWQLPLLEVPMNGRGADVRAPSLAHAFPCSAYYQQPVTLNVETHDDFTAIPFCTLYYRRGGEPVSGYKPVNCTGRNLVTLPAAVVTERGIDYYFVAKDEAGNSSRAPNYDDHYSLSIVIGDSILVRVDSTGRNVSQPIGGTQNAYRLFSIPLLLRNPQAEAVFKNYLGEYDRGSTWRFFDYHNGSYYEFGENGYRSFEPGRAFWLIVNKPHAPIKVGAGKTARTSDFANAVCGKNFRKLKLEPGWNLFGVPYNFPVMRDSLRFSGNTDSLKNQIWIYKGAEGWRCKPSTLWPWEGYAIRSDSSHTMDIRPVAPGSHGSFSKAQVVEANGSGWSIRIEARCGGAADLDNFAGVQTGAAEDWDIHDLYEPPPIGDYVALAFPHQDWGDRWGDFAGDFRPLFAEGKIWEFQVKANLKENLTALSFENLERVPGRFEIHLFDKNRQIVQNLREKNRYAYNELGELLPGRFELIVGTPAFVQAREAVQAVPDQFELYANFPNPFSRETIISFSLPSAITVWLKIFDVMGREVCVLNDGKSGEKGRNYLRWDGRDRNGRKVGSGVYILSLQAGELRKQQRIILLR